MEVNTGCLFLGEQSKDSENTAEKSESDFTPVKVEEKEQKPGQNKIFFIKRAPIGSEAGLFILVWCLLTHESHSFV